MLIFDELSAFRETRWRREFQMPLYEFNCRACGHRFDELVRLGETPHCPKCSDPGPERLFSASAGVSTERSRKRAAGVARRAASKIKREKDHAQAVYERNYRKEHYEGG